MASPIADAIRRIVGFDPTRSNLSNATSRGPISGKTGIGFMQADKASAGGVTGGKGSTLGNIKPEDGMIKTPTSGNNTGGNIVDATDPTKGIYSSGDGSYNAEDVINPEDLNIELHDSEALLTGVGMLTSAAQGGGTLNELKGITDCVSGKSIAIRMDGKFAPPPGWNDDTTPPPATPEDQWVVGYAWGATQGTNPTKYANYSGAAAYAKSYLEGAGAIWPGDTLVESYTSFADEGSDAPDQFVSAATTYQVRIRRVSTGEIFLGGVIGMQDCSNPFYGAPYCPEFDPTIPTHWPEDEEMQISRSPTGGLSTSTWEPEADIVPGLIGGDMTSINFCFDGGTRQGRMEATNEGGYMIYETIDGAGTGIYKIFGPDNRVKGYADGVGAQAYRIIPGEAIP
jgi:hypothetical protein